MYIIVWAHNSTACHLDENSRGFMETYSSEEEARKAAEEIEERENKNSPSQWYFNFKIYREC